MGKGRKMDKKLTFKILHGEELYSPRWREIEAENTTCPLCGQNLIVCFAPDKGLYAYCHRCDKYFVSE